MSSNLTETLIIINLVNETPSVKSTAITQKITWRCTVKPILTRLLCIEPVCCFEICFLNLQINSFEFNDTITYYLKLLPFDSLNFSRNGTKLHFDDYL